MTQDARQRGALPIPDLAYTGTVTYDATDPDTHYPPIERLLPPEGAPNVLVVLIDDTGFGASSAFGGPVQTPSFERVAAQGLKYTRFHTTALCSPTRAALLSGRNHHSVGMGGITEIATSAPGYSSLRPNSCAPLAETLKLNGYSTAQFGKCHEVPVWEASAVGPFDHWPHPGGGFEYFYGFIGGETNQWYPAIYENTSPVEPWGTPEDGYHFMADMTDKAIDWTRQQKSLAPDKPFFTYFAPGATHAPHHVPTEWSDRYKGAFDQGWDAVREETFARQKELGVIPQDAVLTARSPGIPAWDEMSETIKPALARQMEVYAGFLAYADHHVGRLLDALEDMGELDDTLVYVIIGDNGASAEGSMHGTTNEGFTINHMNDIETEEYVAEHIDDIGTPRSYNHYAVGWAHAMDTPYQWTKQVASHWGGTRNGTIVSWPNGGVERGGIRNQFAHVIDVAPTVLAAAGIPEPSTVHGVTQRPYEGTAMNYTFDDAAAPEQHVTQYFEMVGNRAIFHKGWTAVAKHKDPWLGSDHGLDEDRWDVPRCAPGSTGSRRTSASTTSRSASDASGPWGWALRSPPRSGTWASSSRRRRGSSPSLTTACCLGTGTQRTSRWGASPSGSRSSRRCSTCRPSSERSSSCARSCGGRRQRSPSSSRRRYRRSTAHSSGRARRSRPRRTTARDRAPTVSTSPRSRPTT
ncbi:arylsulfatase [Oerskovia enterophila]|uniref:Arylsulfatase n=1 Tax=Oerskovia enterophila TaxID=43678 RepID=A0ABX2Y6X3_9CELL|nr:arylsulfatase [Oerskovia enterophila]